MKRPTLGIFSLSMINVAAVCSVKNWSFIAEYGFSSLFFVLLAAIAFLIPVALVAAELGSAFPRAGGIYAWVKEAFGHRAGFLAVWLLWFQNVLWYPAILSFIAATLAYVFNPDLSENFFYTASIVVVAFWAMTLLNMLGMRISGLVSTLGVIFGTFIPGVLIIVLGLLWGIGGGKSYITMSWDSFIPNLGDPGQLVFFIGILFAFAGMEMSAVHAKDVINPHRSFPRAIFFSLGIILLLTVFGVLSIASVLPQEEISLTAGSMQAFTKFLGAYNLSSLIPWIAALVCVGAVGGLSTWIIGPCKGLLAAAQGGDLPPFLHKVNRHAMPVPLMIVQGVIVTVMALMFVFMPSVSSAFWILTALGAQVYLIMYVLMFVTAIKLRYTRKNVVRSYRVPGGNLGMWMISGIGILACVVAFGVGFFPPNLINAGNHFFYVTFLISGIVIVSLAPTIILLYKKPSWDVTNHSVRVGKKEKDYE